jgi:serine/threonine protein kinase
MAERESLAIEAICPYLAGGVDDRRTWVAYAAAEGPSLQDLADAISADSAFSSSPIAARIVGDAAMALREVLKRAPLLPAAGIDDARIGIDGRLVLGHLGEVSAGPRLEEPMLVAELGRWIVRLTGTINGVRPDGEPCPLYPIAQRSISGELRWLSELADTLEEVGGSSHGAIAAWLCRIADQRPRIAAPALFEELDLPPDPDPNWVTPSRTPASPLRLEPREHRGPARPPTPVPAAYSAPPAPHRSATPAPHRSVNPAPQRTAEPARAREPVAPRSTPVDGRAREAAGSGVSPGSGTVIGGRYRLVQRVANGMMGRVYEATRLSDNQRVALKLLQPSEDDPLLAAQYQARFRREAEALARLDHPNIVRVYECGFDSESWLAMEYVDGSTLAKILRTRGHLPASEVLTISRQLCAALNHAHDQGVIHRDLKPANVILVRDDPRRVRLVDFGLAKDWDGSADLTNDGTLLGTPHYMSPEQCNGDSAGVESDLYALGMVMYRLLTGRMPFEGKRGAAILLAHTASPVPSFQSLGLGFTIASPIERIVRKCLEKKPEHRFRSAAELDRALLACANGSPVLLTPVAAPPRAPTERFPLPTMAMSRRSVVASVVAVAALAFLAVGSATGATVAWLLGRNSPEVAEIVTPAGVAPVAPASPKLVPAPAPAVPPVPARAVPAPSPRSPAPKPASPRNPSRGDGGTKSLPPSASRTPSDPPPQPVVPVESTEPAASEPPVSFPDAPEPARAEPSKPANPLKNPFSRKE